MSVCTSELWASFQMLSPKIGANLVVYAFCRHAHWCSLKGKITAISTHMAMNTRNHYFIKVSNEQK